MNTVEAQLILSAYRPNGADANDSVFEEALSFARCDPATKSWLSEQLNFDRRIAAALQQVCAPRKLIGELRAGMRLGVPAPSFRRWQSLFGRLAPNNSKP